MNENEMVVEIDGKSVTRLIDHYEIPSEISNVDVPLWIKVPVLHEGESIIRAFPDKVIITRRFR
jgi:hypothetical protein